MATADDRKTAPAALESLKSGNSRFVAGEMTHPAQSAARRTELAENGQQPFAVILGCADSRIALCRYGDLVSEPDLVMRRAYEFLGCPYPGSHIVRDVFSGSRGKGREVPLSQPVLSMCEDLLVRLDEADAQRIDTRRDPR